MHLCVLGWDCTPVSLPCLPGPHLFFTLSPPQPSSAAPACCKVSLSEFLLGFSSDHIINCAFMCQPSCKLLQGKGPFLISSTFLFIRPFKNKDRENGLHNGLKSDPDGESWLGVSLLPLQVTENPTLSPEQPGPPLVHTEL